MASEEQGSRQLLLQTRTTVLTESASILILDVPASRPLRNKSMLFKPYNSEYFVIATQADLKSHFPQTSFTSLVVSAWILLEVNANTESDR